MSSSTLSLYPPNPLILTSNQKCHGAPLSEEHFIGTTVGIDSVISKQVPMASTSLHLLPRLNPSFIAIRKPQTNLPARCSPNNSPGDPEFPSPGPTFQTTIPPESFPVEKRRRSEILRDRARKKAELAKAEPPNFEIGWKRTKKTQAEKPVGHVIMDFLEKLEELMGRGEFGSTTLLAKAGEIVGERAREEAELLREEGKVEERMVTELSRVLKLMEMDLAMVSAAVKEDTLIERLQIAQARCRQAILVAASF